MTPRVSAVVLEHHEPGRIGIGESRPGVSWRVGDALSSRDEHTYDVAFPGWPE
jgi:hypothetical protein